MKILLVDGYNVLRSSGYYSHLVQEMPDHTDDAFNLARQTLITDVATFAGHDYEATIVFDGAGNPFSTGEEQKVAGVNVIFSSVGVSADTVIEEHAHKAAEQGREIVVVTSDAATQWTVFRDKVTRMSAAGFSQEMQGIREEVTEAHDDRQLRRNTLAERVDGSTREALERLARGERS